MEIERKLAALGLEMLLIPWVYRYVRVIWEHVTLPTR